MGAEPDRIPLSGIWYRHVRADGHPYGLPPVTTGGRWQRAHVVGAVYLADSPHTGWAEFYRALAEMEVAPAALMPQRRAAERARHAEATASNLGLGHDIRAALADPSADQLNALREIVCRLICAHYPELIAYGAGWTDAERQQPVGDTGRHEPRQIDAIVDGELQRALRDSDPLRGIAQLVARWGAAFLLDHDGVTRTKALGSERMARRLRDALPPGEHPLRAALWELMRPMLSPRLVALHRDAFTTDSTIETTVDVAAHRSESSLDELDLEEHDTEAA